MGIKEDFAAFKTQVDARLLSIEGKMANPATPAEVAAGMQQVLTTLETIDTAAPIVPPSGEPL